jgi:hypothetical protein
MRFAGTVLLLQYFKKQGDDYFPLPDFTLACELTNTR